MIFPLLTLFLVIFIMVSSRVCVNVLQSQAISGDPQKLFL
jgi:hypothetical protein